MFCGLPCSGKSTKAQEFAKEYNATIFSSDSLRQEMFGDVNEQKHNQELFVELHNRIKNQLMDGKSAIYDATNISYKRRMAFLAELKKIPCEKICVLMATPYEECLRRNAERERKVPEEVIKRMYMNFTIPYWYEGWDDIRIIGPQTSRYDVDEVVNSLVGYDQGNSHHSLSLGDHLWKAYDIYCNAYLSLDDCDDVNTMATILHDMSKPFCRTEVNSRGVNDGNVHYYNHQFASAYDSLFVNTLHDRLDVAIRIMWHMQPYFWEKDNNEKLHNKYRQLWGEELYQDVMCVHAADKAAH
jgi:predicted kinase